MSDFTLLVNIVRDAMPVVVQPTISAVVGAFVTSMFLRGNTQRSEFEKIKMGKIREAIDDLLNNGVLTLTEVFKCRNLIKIAEIADKEYKKKFQEDNDKMNHEFDFDWFLRFFEAAGNVSNEDMQFLWARILAGEVKTPNSFSIRTLETLRNMTQNDAFVFNKMAQFVLFNEHGIKFLYRNDYHYSKKCNINVNELYGISDKELNILDECGILRPWSSDTIVNFNENNYFLFNKNIAIKFQVPENSNSSNDTPLHSHLEITKIGEELISIIDIQSNDNYILDLGLFFKNEHPELEINAYKIKKNDDNDDYHLDYTNDLFDKHKSDITWE